MKLVDQHSHPQSEKICSTSDGEESFALLYFGPAI